MEGPNILSAVLSFVVARKPESQGSYSYRTTRTLPTYNKQNSQESPIAHTPMLDPYEALTGYMQRKQLYDIRASCWYRHARYHRLLYYC